MNEVDMDAGIVTPANAPAELTGDSQESARLAAIALGTLMGNMAGTVAGVMAAPVAAAASVHPLSAAAEPHDEEVRAALLEAGVIHTPDA